MPRSSYLGLAVAVCLALAGCGGGGPDAKYRIAVIPKGLTHEFWQSIHRGADRAAADLGAKGTSVAILWDGPRKESDALEQIRLVQQKASMGIHGLVLAPQDSRQMVPYVEETVDRGIPVAIIDSGLDPAALERKPDLIVKYVATDNYHGGAMAAERLLKVLADAGNSAPRLVLFRYQPGSESTEQREQGFLDFVNRAIDKQKKAGKPTISIISDNVYAGATVETAKRAAGPLLVRLSENPPDGIFAVNESATTGMLQAMRNREEKKKISLVGFDSSKDLLQAVRDGEVDGLIVQDPYRMGYLGVWMLVQYLEGYNTLAGGRNLSTGEYLVTRDNVDAEATRALFDAEAQARRTIKVPELKKR